MREQLPLKKGFVTQLPKTKEDPGHAGEAPGLARSQRSKGKARAGALSMVSLGKARQGRQGKARQASSFRSG